MKDVLEAIKSGGVVVYPTETLYAVGCSAFDGDAVERICRIKERPVDKPLPLIIGDFDQLELVTEHRPEGLDRLVRKFWPGPLSVLVRAGELLPPQLSDRTGYVSVRVTENELAAELCRKTGLPLVATSANRSGHVPAARHEDLDPMLLEKVDAILTGPPFPLGGAPSTLVRLISPYKVVVLRSGAVSVDAIENNGFQVLSR